ncbi:hypothetical protein PVAND_006747 [Polypedilum vanderplanki]|uniref:F-box domain-containing protein n=1 Tax=Polypedilum vanderplanki TaxID=319348 RepID=A0A9J6C4K9_POLVA|nr:hypothetical protein PVAND_006747 [Polypedilum vanderplanki]
MTKESELQFNGLNHAALLPMEILIKIFQYLNPMDRHQASFVCKRLLEASEHFYFTDDTQVNFNKITFSDNFSPAKDFLTSFRSFPNIQFTEVEFADCECFFQKHGIEIECLSIISCDISEKKLSSILQATPNVTSLKIQKCSDLFISGRLLSDSSFKMENVTNLSLAENRHLTDLLFNRITSLMPNLSSLDLSSNTISFHKGLFKKYYPGNHDEELSGSKTVLTLHYIQKFFRQRAQNIKSLNFNSTLIDGNALQVLADIEDLQLESLFLRSCEQLTNEGIISLVSVQTNLQVLDLSCTARLTDMALIHICEQLKKLRVLKIRRCHALTDISVKMISDLSFLEVLDISECKSLTSQSIIDGIASRSNDILIELYLSALNLSNAAVVKVAENIPNLRVLDLSYCINHVDDVCVQMVLKNLTKLRELNLDLCERISDAGLTGMSMDNQINQDELSISKEVQEQKKDAIVSGSNHYTHDPIKHHIRISLKSKAEEEIVEDALRKRAMLQLAKEINLKEQPCNSFGLARLKGLRVLRLGGCNKVTDVSLIYNFKLPELKEINLSKCQQISLQGISELVKNCPALEIVNLSECHNVDDKCIELITSKLPRLTKLDISRCYKLTDFSLDYIAINCKRIRILNVAGCKHMSDEPHLKLINIETLRDVSINKRGSDIENTNKIPRPPMLSSLFKR